MNKPKKKFKETRVGQFLANVAPDLLGAASDLLPDAGVLKMVGKLIKGDSGITPQNKEEALKLLEIDIVEMQELTKRLEADNEHTITRLIRPVTFGCMFILFLAMVFFDGNIGEFNINPLYIPVIQSLFGTMTIFYFGSRGIEKVMKTIKNK
tara:strand:- start:534 stop:989 length:456 start_codon:yes stop_codon:yes gene_type:complete